jgi:hypothetical protein
LLTLGQEERRVTDDVAGPWLGEGTGIPRVDAVARHTARRAWERLEALVVLGYLAPEVHAAHREVGLKGRLMGYVAGRVAPLGPVPAQVAIAAFHGFAPVVLHRALPDAWTFASPEDVIAATREGVAHALAPYAEGLEHEVRLAAELSREAALLHPIVGRTLAAGWASLSEPHDPLVALWQAATLVREARGDGHVALLVAAGLEGVEAHLLFAGDSPKLRAALSPLRGWSEPEWDAGVVRLQERGLLDPAGAMTDAGRALRRAIEDRTDELAAPPWVALGEDASAHLLASLDPMLRRIVDAEVLPTLVSRRLRD